MNSIIGKGGFVYVNLTGLVYSTEGELVDGSKTTFPGMHKMLEEAMKTGKTIVFQSMTRKDAETETETKISFPVTVVYDPEGGENRPLLIYGEFGGGMMLGITANSDDFHVV